MTTDIDPHDLVRDVATRGAAVVGLAGIALIHLLDSIGKWTEPLGLASLFVEGAVLAVSTYAFTMAGRVRALSGGRIPVRPGTPVTA
jgi:hypothetical protein